MNDGFSVFLEDVSVTPHTCEPPEDGTTVTVALRPDWECGVCGRVWRLHPWPTGYAHWIEIRGPR